MRVPPVSRRPVQPAVAVVVLVSHETGGVAAQQVGVVYGSTSLLASIRTRPSCISAVLASKFQWLCAVAGPRPQGRVLEGRTTANALRLASAASVGPSAERWSRDGGVTRTAAALQ